MSRTVDRVHVVHAAGAIVHMRKHQHGDGAVERRQNYVGLHQPQCDAAFTRQAFRDIEVGWKIVPFGHDDRAPGRVGARQIECCAQHLEKIDRRRVGHYQFAVTGADHARDLVADALRQVDPAGGVPALHQVAAPLRDYCLLHARGRRLRQRAERISVEVDHACG